MHAYKKGKLMEFSRKKPFFTFCFTKLWNFYTIKPTIYFKYIKFD